MTATSACPDGRCDGSGFLYDEAARTARPCSCRPARLARKRAASVAGRLPNLYRGVSFDREPLVSLARTAPNEIRAVMEYCRNIHERLDAGRGMWFIGDVGTGKTTLAMLISKTAMDEDRTVAIYSLPRLLAMLRETFGERARYSLIELINRLCSVDLLHIDDVGAEQTSPWVLEQLYTIINTRYEDRRSVVITTNLVTDGPKKVFKDDGQPEIDPETGRQLEHHPDHELRRQIGDRTVSRLSEMCGMPIRLFGEDLRSFVKFDPPSDHDAHSYARRRDSPANAIDRWHDAVEEEVSPYGRPLPGRTSRRAGGRPPTA